MSLLRHVYFGLRALLRRKETDAEISDEVRHYLDEAVQSYVDRGFSREEAERYVRLELGSSHGIREQVRSYGWQHAIESFFADVRYGLRQFKAAPLFSLVAILTIAAGVGATTAILSAVYPVLLDRLPYPDSDRIVTINEMNKDGSRNDGTFGMYRGLVERSRGFEAIAVARSWAPALTGRSEPERLEGQRVSASYFNVLGVKPLLGRSFIPAEDVVQGPGVVIISHPLWVRRFHSDPAIIGQSITLDEQSFLVIGVMPREFENVLAPPAELWAPLQYGMAQGRAWGHHLRTIGRLMDGVSIAQGTEEVDRIAKQILKEKRPVTYGSDVKLIVRSLQDEIISGVKTPLLALLGAAGLVFLIACVNTTNLLIARGVQRRGEFALRSALGAVGGRLIRQSLTESSLLAVCGGTTGLAIAIAGTRALVALAPPDLPRIDAVGVNAALFVFAFLLTTLIGLAFGLMPARVAAQSDFHEGLQQSAKRFVGNYGRTRKALVIVQVALSLILLVGSGLLWRSMERLFAVDPGFDPSGTLTMQVHATGQLFSEDSAADAFFMQVIDSVKQVPRVNGAAFTSQLPMSGDLDEYGVHFEATANQEAQSYSAFRYAVSHNYLAVMRIRLLKGRSFQETDRDSAPRVALISETLARLRFGRKSPLGHHLRIGPMEGQPYTIIGVAADVKQLSLGAEQAPAVYVPFTQWPFKDQSMSLVARIPSRAATLNTAIREAVWSVDKNQPIVRVATMEELVASTAVERRFVLILFQIFATVALVLAAAGLYGLLAGSVAERTREIGVRSALGASRDSIVMMILRQGISLAGIGIALGLIIAPMVAQGISTLLFEISPMDPLTYFAIIFLLGIVTILSCSLPAWRASQIDPAVTLRAE